MSVRFETIKTGDVLLDCHTTGMGNTTMRAMGVWEVRVREIDADGRRALVSWNGHPPEWLTDDWNGPRCYVCRARKRDGHRPDCAHPRAVSARKRAPK